MENTTQGIYVEKRGRLVCLSVYCDMRLHGHYLDRILPYIKIKLQGLCGLRKISPEKF